MFNIFLNKRPCPKCNEPIKITDKVCPFCGEDVGIKINIPALDKDTKLIVKCVVACLIAMMCFSFINQQIQMMRYRSMKAKAEKILKANVKIESVVLSMNSDWHFDFIRDQKPVRTRSGIKIPMVQDSKISDFENYIAKSENYEKIGDREYQCRAKHQSNILFKFQADGRVKFINSTTGDVAIYRYEAGELVK